jgi:hypothetical protein
MRTGGMGCKRINMPMREKRMMKRMMKRRIEMMRKGTGKSMTLMIRKRVYKVMDYS